MRILLTIEYDGTNYAGWQLQKNAPTVQQAVEEAIFATLHRRCRVFGAGRTDSGVHALGQRAHFDCETGIPAERMAYVLNTALPADIRIVSSLQVGDDFHVRKGARRKHYRYTIHNAPHASAIARHTSYHVRQDLDIGLMRRAAGHIVGTHDFSSFRAAGSNIIGSVRTVYSLAVDRRGSEITIDIEGSGFLYNMVRIIAGTLIEAGKGARDPDGIPAVIAARDRRLAGPTAPGHGLTLVSVTYDDYGTVDPRA